jgi:hypothetical protein
MAQLKQMTATTILAPVARVTEQLGTLSRSSGGNLSLTQSFQRRTVMQRTPLSLVRMELQYRSNWV